MGKGESEFEEKVMQGKNHGVKCDGWPEAYFILIALESCSSFQKNVSYVWICLCVSLPVPLFLSCNIINYTYI